METKYLENGNDEQKKVQVPISFKDEQREVQVPIVFENEKRVIEVPISFEKKGGGQERNFDEKEILKSDVFAGRETSEENDEYLHTLRQVTPAVSFFVNQVDLNKGSIEPTDITDALGGEYVMNRETVAAIATPFIEQAMEKGNKLPDNFVRLAQQLRNGTFQSNVRNNIQGKMANYILAPKYITVFLARDGQEINDKRSITFTATIVEDGERVELEYTILSSEIDKINNLVKRKCSFAVLYDPADAKMIVNQFRKDTKRIPQKICFEFAGWVKYAGQHIYLHKGVKLPGAEVVTNLNLPCDEQIGKMDLARIFDQAIQLYWDDGVSYTLLLYSLLGVLYRPFDEAGYPPHFLLFVNGISGSFKTSICKILYTQLADDTYRNSPRRIDADSMTSLEVALTKSGQDTVTLLDDFSPAKTMQQKNERENKLESIIRQVGDGSSKSRSNARLEDVRGEGIRGMVAITGELRGKGLSSALRCLFVELTKEKVDLTALSWFQERPDAFTTFIYHFALFTAEHWEYIVGMIKDRFGSYRSEASKVLQAKRLVDTLCTLWVTTDVLLAFMEEYCKYNFIDIEARALWVRQMVCGIVTHSENLSQEDDPAKIFMQALYFLINHGEILLCPPGETSVLYH